MKRYLTSPAIELALKNSKMAFISGPRQVGKTTLAKDIMPSFSQGLYFNWDVTSNRRTWVKSPNSIIETIDETGDSILVLDEIHKAKGWKNSLKGLWDTRPEKLSVLVTGSARLNVFRKGGDSLLGRYYNFRLHPLSVAEVEQKKIPSPDDFMKQILSGDLPRQSQHDVFDALIKVSGFPEPFLKNSSRNHRLWQQNRRDRLIREDLRDLTRIPDLSQIEMLSSLLPERVGSLFSVQSLREDLMVSFDTVKRWLAYLEELYYIFTIRPYSQKIARSLKREPKVYLYDWTEIIEPGPRFENMVASHLLKACHFWSDTGDGSFELNFARTKEKREIDFVILRDKKPWLAVECKLTSANLDTSNESLHAQLKVPLIQLVASGSHFRKIRDRAYTTLICDANRFLAALV